jgi:adenylate cyclase
MVSRMSPLSRIERLARAGTDHAGNAWDARRVTLVNALALLTVVLSWASVPAAFLDARPEALPLNLAAQVLVGSVIALNARGHAGAAAATFCVLAAAAITGQVVLLGAESGVYHWYIPVMMTPLLVFPARRSGYAVALAVAIFVCFVVVAVRFEATRGASMSLVWAEFLAILALLALSVQTRFTTLEAERRVDEERARADGLLHNMLPDSIARRLLAGERPADRHPDVTVLFADLVHFTQLAESLPADRVVQVLDRVFTAFDALVEAHGLEKIKTIGDAYMVASGVPEARADHVDAAARLALDMRRALVAIEAEERLGLEIRIGLHCGPVVAGVIGTRRYAYDLWSDVVNVAARMEHHGTPGRIHVSDAVAERIRAAGGPGAPFALSARGLIDVKGKGAMHTWWLDAASRTPSENAA